LRPHPANVTKISGSSESARGLAQSKSWRPLAPAVKKFIALAGVPTMKIEPFSDFGKMMEEKVLAKDI